MTEKKKPKKPKKPKEPQDNEGPKWAAMRRAGRL